MNQQYLSKIVNQETLNAKIEITQKNLNEARLEASFLKQLSYGYDNSLNESTKQNLLQEYIIGSRALDRTGKNYIDIKDRNEKLKANKETTIKIWSDSASGKYLESMGARPVLAGTNIYAYEIDTNVWNADKTGGLQNSNQTDRIWLYDNGRAWSTRTALSMGWQYEAPTVGLEQIEDTELRKEFTAQIKKEFKTSEKIIKLYNHSPNTTIKVAKKVIIGTLAPGTKDVEEDEKAKLKPYFIENSGINKEAKYISFQSFYAKVEADKVKDEQKAAGAGLLDTFQTVLDWAGFVPVIGDAIDVINAAIYFIRYLYSNVSTYLWQALFSLIAVIPMVGSVIAGILKSGYKGITKIPGGVAKLAKLFKSGSKVPDVERAYLMMHKFGVSTSYLRTLGKGMTHFGNIFSRALTWVRKFASKIFGKGSKPDSLIKSLDGISDTLKKNSRAANKAAEKIEAANVKAAAKAGEDAAGAVVGTMTKTSQKVYENSKGFFSRMSGNIIPKLRQSAWWPKGKVQLVSDTLTRNFKSRAFKNPGATYAFFSKKAGLKTMDDIRTTIKNVQKGSYPISKHSAKFKQAMLATDVGKNYAKKGYIPKPSELEKFIEFMEKQPGMGDAAISIRKNISDAAVDMGTVPYQAYRDNLINQLGAGMWNTSSIINKEGALQLKYLGGTFAKKTDIIWNETEDFREDMNWAHEDDSLDQKQGVIYPLIKDAINFVMPGVASGVKSFGGMVQDPRIAEVSKAGLGILANTFGIDTAQLVDYDPTSGGEGTYE